MYRPARSSVSFADELSNHSTFLVPCLCMPLYCVYFGNFWVGGLAAVAKKNLTATRSLHAKHPKVPIEAARDSFTCKVARIPLYILSHCQGVKRRVIETAKTHNGFKNAALPGARFLNPRRVGEAKPTSQSKRVISKRHHQSISVLPSWDPCVN